MKKIFFTVLLLLASADVHAYTSYGGASYSRSYSRPAMSRGYNSPSASLTNPTNIALVSAMSASNSNNTRTKPKDGLKYTCYLTNKAICKQLEDKMHE